MDNKFMEGKNAEDFPKRRADFIRAYGEIVEKHQCDFMTQPTFIPNEKGTWEVVIATEVVDKKFLVKSPVIVG